MRWEGGSAMKKIKVIGAGGIGSILLSILARYLNYLPEERYILTIIDGDTYEIKNRERQIFHEIGNKAEVLAEEIKREFPELEVRGRNRYVTPDNLPIFVDENDIVFLCVDNHATRKAVSDHCRELSDVILISGGNTLTDGNIQVFIRQNGQDLTLPLDNDYHMEIRNPRDKRPDEMSCEELTASQPQLLFMNNTIAAMMLNAFYAHSQGKLNYNEIFADIITGNHRAVKR